MKRVKQHITEKQWNELDKEEQVKFWKKLSNPIGVGVIYEVSIGQLIEFLGDDLTSMNIHDKEGGGLWWWIISKDKEFFNVELIDALWEACRYKISNKIL